MTYETIVVRVAEAICYIEFNRAESQNTINDRLVGELHDALSNCEGKANAVVLSGSKEVFCFGADFGQISAAGNLAMSQDGPMRLYDLWLRMAQGPFVTIANVRGKANAGGVGFVAASDIVVADETAQFSLSELLFGVYPACVLPFLARRIGFQRAHYLTLSTSPIYAEQACHWGLVDVLEQGNDTQLRRLLSRLRRLSPSAIGKYKKYSTEVAGDLERFKVRAVAANLEAFSDPKNRAGIARYVKSGIFPWEQLDGN